MLCCAVLCYALLCYAMLCYAMLRQVPMDFYDLIDQFPDFRGIISRPARPLLQASAATDHPPPPHPPPDTHLRTHPLRPRPCSPSRPVARCAS